MSGWRTPEAPGTRTFGGLAVVSLQRPIAIWSNRHVVEAISAMKAKRAPEFAPLAELKGFREV